MRQSRPALVVALAVAAASLATIVGPTPSASAITLPSADWQEVTVFNGLNRPTAVRFASDGRVFVAEQGGVIKVFDGLADPTATVFADLSTNVQGWWDRGLLGFTLNPSFPTDPSVYVLYTYNHILGDAAAPPRWPDSCPTPPGATSDGCVVSGRLSRLTAAGNEWTGVEQVLVEDWCSQYPSHSTGALGFGADGALYASAGDGASFNFVDYGQDGSPVNPCGDPPGGVGGAMSAPSAQGGALRSQDLRTTGDPTTLDGSIIRVNPTTGAALPDNPAYATGADENARRIVSYGFRNPYRWTFRPGTSELWVGDVGWSTREEIDRVTNPLGGVTNHGWPCYEGPNRQSGYDDANLTVCENLYSAGAGAHASPYFSYQHGSPVVGGDTCPTGSGSSTSGVAFFNGGSYPTLPLGTYPAAYDGALFFADYSRDCIWVMRKGANGLPDPALAQRFGSSAANPVDLQIGPGGDLYYVDIDGGTIRRIRYFPGNRPPVAAATATPPSGPAPLAVTLDGTSSSDPDADTLTYAWDLDNDGQYDDATGATTATTFTTSGVKTVRLRVTDGPGLTATTTLTIPVGDTPPVVTIGAPASSFTWAVGQDIAFSGSATDAQDGTLAGTALDWQVILNHCEEGGGCHQHALETFDNVASGTVAAPDHEWPSTLELRVTATDSVGLTDTESVVLQPKTVQLSFASVPSGLGLTVGPTPGVAPFTRTVIEGSTNTVSAPSPQTLGSTPYAFSSWSDGGAASHTVVAGASATLTATYATDAGAVSFVSDDFNAVGLDPRWVEVDPVGDGSVSVVGAGSGDAHLVLGVPATVSHNPAPPNKGLRVVQAAADEDFGIEVKFDSEPSLKNQSQGLMVEQDSSNWLRFDTYSTGSVLKGYVSSTAGGSTVVRANVTIPNGSRYLRVTRVGDLWTFQTSTSGSSWVTRASFSAVLDVARVGPMVGNHPASGGVPPSAFTGLVDYFFNTASPIVPEDGDAVQQHSLTTGVVGSGSVVRSPDQASYAAGTVVTLTAVPAAGSTFSGWSGDLSGTNNPTIITMSADRFVTATFVADTIAPVISNVSVDPASSSAVVTWTTGEPATSAVSYGPTTAYENGTISNPALVTSHTVTLPVLAPASTYHFRVSSTDAAGNPATTTDATFTTDAGAVSFVSDDFNAVGLDPRWVEVDPVGDGSVSVVGAGSGDAHLVLGVPATVSHNPAPPNKGLRVVQAAADEDFGIEVKFDSEPSLKNQSQGLMVEQDSSNWLRFDTYSTGSVLKGYVSSTAGGSTVVRANVTIPNGSRYLRVTRVGDLWTFQTSTSGSSWVTRASFSAVLDVARVGPMVGNHPASGGVPPSAFTGLVDYFFNTASPIVPEDG